MKGQYPHFKLRYSQEELNEHFSLTEAELKFIRQFRGDVNQLGVAMLLKSILYLGYFPAHPLEIPTRVREFIAFDAENLLIDYAEHYPKEGGTRDYHLAAIRQYTGFRYITDGDKRNFDESLWGRAEQIGTSEDDWVQAAIEKFYEMRVELPVEDQLRRLATGALNQFTQRIYEQVSAILPDRVKKKCDDLLIISDESNTSPFEQVKEPPDKAGMKSLKKEIWKLQTLNSTLCKPEYLQVISPKFLRLLSRRAKNEDTSRMRDHPDPIRWTLMACFVHQRTATIIDTIVKIFVQMIHRIEIKAEKHLEKILLKRVLGKFRILHDLSLAALNNPGGIVKDVIFSRISEEILKAIVLEYQAWGPRHKRKYRMVMKDKYSHHYRAMVPLVLEHISFRSSNRFQPVIEALEVIKRTFNHKGTYFHEPVPIDGLVTPNWGSLVFEETRAGRQINRRYYELCTLQRLERALKCKEAWVEGGFYYRSPDEDLPTDWNSTQAREDHYKNLDQPIEVKSFLDPIRERLRESLAHLNSVIAKQHGGTSIYFPGNQQQRGVFHIPKIVAKPEPAYLRFLRDSIQERFGVQHLLDVFVEADRWTHFSDCFTHSGTKEVRTREELQPLIMLSLFAEGTNIGVKRVAHANQFYKQKEIQFVRKYYLNPDSIRNAISTVVNATLKFRNPEIWGEGDSCASDGKRFGSWNQNLTTEWRSRYKGYGVLVYWHVETNALCIFSQLKSFSASEVAAMIEGLVRHDTEARIKKNFVDSHGQSEVAFGFCKLLNQFRLMPRLKRIKYERLYLPDNQVADQLHHLRGVLRRPIKWQLIEQQYDEMMKMAVAVKGRYGSSEAVLRRFNSYNKTHPTYKAIAELGKAEKTIFLCEYISSPELQQEIQDGLNVVEGWNAVTDFIRYAEGSELATNDPENQEMAVLCLHLLQNCMVFVNTIMIQRVLVETGMIKSLSQEDLKSISPLIHTHINPYGRFELNLLKPSFLQVA